MKEFLKINQIWWICFFVNNNRKKNSNRERKHLANKNKKDGKFVQNIRPFNSLLFKDYGPWV